MRPAGGALSPGRHGARAIAPAQGRPAAYNSSTALSEKCTYVKHSGT
jgi:hypothetical protein